MYNQNVTCTRACVLQRIQWTNNIIKIWIDQMLHYSTFIFVNGAEYCQIIMFKSKRWHGNLADYHLSKNE